MGHKISNKSVFRIKNQIPGIWRVIYKTKKLKRNKATESP
jgi:hypothetical protein